MTASNKIYLILGTNSYYRIEANFLARAKERKEMGLGYDAMVRDSEGLWSFYKYPEDF